jgi:hypothetical protein
MTEELSHKEVALKLVPLKSKLLKVYVYTHWSVDYNVFTVEQNGHKPNGDTNMHMNHIEPGKTYKTEANAVKAAEQASNGAYRFMTAWTEDGRCYPIFVGIDAMHMVHKGFIVVG